MRCGNGLRKGLLVVGTIALLGACSGNADAPAPTDSSPAPSVAPSTSAGANGQVYTSASIGEETILRRFPVNVDGSVGEPVQVLKAASDETTFPSVVDSLGDTLLTGTYTDYWTKQLQLRDLAGAETGSLTVDRWCGGEALVANQCTLLDATHLVRTTELGGETTTAGSVIVSDLSSGSTVDQYGPFPGLSRMLGTTEPNIVLLATTTEQRNIDDPTVPGTIIRLDTSTGQTSEVGDYPADWDALCAVGVDGVIGQTLGEKPELVAVGTTSVGDVTLTQDDTVAGCSADGAFLYLQNFTDVPDGGDLQDSASTLERVNLATGARDEIATLPGGEWVGPITR
jgi:hypothetical protein